MLIGLGRLRFGVLALAGAMAMGQGGCAPGDAATADLSLRTIQVVATTSMIAEMARGVGGERVEVAGLMGPGVDPHLYKASEGDVSKMAGADIVFYNGLHLEGKMAEIFEQMSSMRVPTHALSRAVPADRLISSQYFVGNHDPHIWFDAGLWALAARQMAEDFAALDSTNAGVYRENAARYADEILEADAYAKERFAEIEPAKRLLVTSHDAFGYFGRAYGFEVRGLQGLSTATEAGTRDVQELARFVAENRVPSLFVESSVSPRGIEAVRAAVRARGFDVQIGGTLFGDALGAPGTEAATYIGTVRSNVDTIVGGLNHD
ncbi:MAG: manganese/zinc/iron transport system substrate-binding protein [Rhodothermales bacterium]|jgi:manganese/zinc/iron transport system substrate-binding protein